MSRKKAKKKWTPAQRKKHRERVRRWRKQFYDKGYTYKKVDGHWTWVKKKKTRKRKYAYLFED